MGKRDIAEQLRDYMTNCGQDAGKWAIDAMAEEIDRSGVASIDDMDPDDFSDVLREWDGKVADYRGVPVDFEAAMHVADPELCEELNDREWGSDQEYFEAYAEAHAARHGGEEFAPYYGLAW